MGYTDAEVDSDNPREPSHPGTDEAETAPRTGHARPSLDPFTPREIERIGLYVADGKSAGWIARALNRSRYVVLPLVHAMAETESRMARLREEAEDAKRRQDEWLVDEVMAAFTPPPAEREPSHRKANGQVDWAQIHDPPEER